MNILLIAATSAEIAPLTEYLPKNWTTSQEGTFVKADIRLSLLITGVGMVSTAYHLTKALSNHTYDLVLLLGIGGSFDRNIPLGDVVFVTTERYGDMGSEDHYNFLDVFELGLEQLHQPRSQAAYSRMHYKTSRFLSDCPKWLGYRLTP